MTTTTRLERARIDDAIARGAEALKAAQDSRGGWIGEVGPTTIPCLMYLLAQAEFGRSDREPTRRALDWLMRHQNDDGGWGQWLGDPSRIDYTKIARQVIRRNRGDEGACRRAGAYVKKADAAGGAGPAAGLENILAQTVLATVGEAPWAGVPLPALPLAIVGLERGMLPGPLPYAGTAAAILKADRGGGRAPWNGFLTSRGERWLIDHLADDGSWMGSVHTTALILLALKDRPAAKAANERALAYCDSVQLDDGGFGMVKTLTIWESVLATLALLSAGVSPQSDTLQRAAGWLEQIQLPDGSWPWDFHPGPRLYGDNDDTIYAVLGLKAIRPASPAISSGLVWVRKMQGPAGGWATFSPVMKRPDMAWAVPDITGHVTEALAKIDGPSSPAVQAGARWLVENQAADGSWRGYWGSRFVYGTSCALVGLAAANAGPEAIQRGAAYIAGRQRPDGGWGEDWTGADALSSVEQTSWALTGLAAAGTPTPDAGIGWLLDAQRPDGSWPYGMTGSFTHRYMGSYGAAHLANANALIALAAWRDR